jgi:hypothetical protein
MVEFLVVKVFTMVDKMCIHDLEGEDYIFLKKNNAITGLEKHIPHTI